jgi:hypothetical protein
MILVGGSVIFTDGSSGATSYGWDFGDVECFPQSNAGLDGVASCNGCVWRTEENGDWHLTKPSCGERVQWTYTRGGLSVPTTYSRLAFDEAIMRGTRTVDVHSMWTQSTHNLLSVGIGTRYPESASCGGQALPGRSQSV